MRISREDGRYILNELMGRNLKLKEGNKNVSPYRSKDFILVIAKKKSTHIFVSIFLFE